MQKRGRADAPIFVAIGATIWVTVAGVAASLAATPAEAILGYCLLSLAVNYVSVAMLTAVNRITANELRGQVNALMTTAAGLIALSVGPFAVGYLSDHVYGQPQGIGSSLATVMAASGALCVASLATARRGYGRMVERSRAG